MINQRQVRSHKCSNQLMLFSGLTLAFGFVDPVAEASRLFELFAQSLQRDSYVILPSPDGALVQLEAPEIASHR